MAHAPYFDLPERKLSTLIAAVEADNIRRLEVPWNELCLLLDVPLEIYQPVPGDAFWLLQSGEEVIGVQLTPVKDELLRIRIGVLPRQRPLKLSEGEIGKKLVAIIAKVQQSS